MKKLVSLLLALLLLVSCTLAVAETAAATVTVTDMTDRTVTLAKPAEKVVVLTASCAEIVYALGKGDTVVGRGEYCDYPAEILNVPSVQSGYETNIESIIALQPDLVIMDTMAQTTEQIAALETAGIPVLMTTENGIAGVYTAIETIGAVMGAEENAAAIVADMKEGFAMLDGLYAEAGITVYFDIEPEAWGLYTCGAGTFMDEIASLLGLKNIFADQTGWVPVSSEQVIALNPDLIVSTNAYDFDGKTPKEELVSRAGWDVISAVADDAIFMADNSAMTRPGPRLLEAAVDLAAYILEKATAE